MGCCLQTKAPYPLLSKSHLQHPGRKTFWSCHLEAPGRPHSCSQTLDQICAPRQIPRARGWCASMIVCDSDILAATPRPQLPRADHPGGSEDWVIGGSGGRWWILRARLVGVLVRATKYGRAALALHKDMPLRGPRLVPSLAPWCAHPLPYGPAVAQGTGLSSLRNMN